MEGIYEVYFAERVCGKVQVLRQGLYYRFICRCQLTGDIVCRLQVQLSDQTVSLGVLVPMDDGFGIHTRIPVKHFSGSPVRFYVSARQESNIGVFAPIYPEEPFSYIEGLKSAYLTKKNGQIGVILK